MRVVALTVLMALSIGGVSPLIGATVVPEGGTLDVTDALAQTGLIECVGSATLRLAMTQKTGGDYVVGASVLATNGTLTIDFSGCSDAPVLFARRFRADQSGHVVVSGATKSVLFGSVSKVPNASINALPAFGVSALSFADGTPASVGIVFTNQVALTVAVPDTARCVVADGSEIWLSEANALPASVLPRGANMTLTAFDVGMTSLSVFPNLASVTIADGRSLAYRGAILGADWTFKSRAAETLLFDVVLSSTTSRFRICTSCTLTGSITGAGGLRVGGDYATGATMRGTYGFSGGVEIASNGNADFGNCTRVDVAPDFILGANTSLYLRSAPAGCVTGAGYDSVVYACNGSMSTIASVAGVLRLDRASASLTSRLLTVADGDPTGATCRVDNEAVVAVAAGSVPHSVVRVTEQGATRVYHLFGVDNVGADIPSNWSDDATLAVSVGKDATLSLTNIVSQSVAVANAGGRFSLGRKTFDYATKALLHLDVSAAGTVVAVTNAQGVVETSDKGDYVQEWFDVRSEQRTFHGINYRYWTANGGSHDKEGNGNGVLVTQPYLRQGALNGKPVLDCCDNSRRFNLFEGRTRGFSPKFCVMVFGSESGGGKALLAAEGGALARGAGTARGNFSATDPITTNDTVSTWLNGVKVTPSSSQLSGGWDIVSIDTTGLKIYGLSVGSDSLNDAPGNGQYAEILFFDRVLADFEREDVERYLAQKWGLAAKYASPKPTANVSVSGHGTVDLAGKVALSGCLDGTMNMYDADVSYVGTVMPTRADVLALSGRVSWIDPDVAETLSFSKYAYRPKEVVGVRDVETGVLPSLVGNGTGNGAANKDMRAAWANRSARGLGPVRTWLDFSNIYPFEDGTEETGGNYYKFTTDGTEAKVAPITGRSFFLISDSTRGGGTPMLDSATGSLIKNRGDKATDPTAPIWPAGTDARVTGGVTYLNGEPVNGTTSGFTGSAELFAFSTTSDLPISHLCYFGTTQVTHGQDYGEMIGETIVFSRVLEPAERKTVERYLMWKWLNLVPSDTTHFAEATFAGTGSVSGTSQGTLPKFADDYSGGVELPDSLAFALPGPSGVVQNPIVAPQATLSFASTDVTVNFSLTSANGRVKAGDYVLADVASFGEATFLIGTVSAKGVSVPHDGWRLAARNGRLTLTVPKKGLVVVVR